LARPKFFALWSHAFFLNELHQELPLRQSSSIGKAKKGSLKRLSRPRSCQRLSKKIVRCWCLFFQITFVACQDEQRCFLLTDSFDFTTGRVYVVTPTVEDVGSIQLSIPTRPVQRFHGTCNFFHIGPIPSLKNLGKNVH
jgi:hypothetical protein